MPRWPRVYLPDALYYVTVMGIYEQEIFKEAEDYKMLLDMVKKYKEEYGFKLYAYALLPNHFHLLLELSGRQKDEKGISAIMHDLNSSYTKYFNGKYARKGHLFKERFRATLVEKQPFLIKVAAYIHLNPQRLNLVSDAKDYPYTSYHFYLEKEIPIDGLINAERNEILGLSGGSSYEEAVNGLIKDLDLNFRNCLKRGILGSKEFEEKVRKAYELYKKEKNNGLDWPKKIGVTAVLAAVLAAGLIFALKANTGRKDITLDPKSLQQIRELLGGLEDAQWQIKVFSAKEGEARSDIIHFKEGRFNSENLTLRGYGSSDYSLVIMDEDTIIWETKQASAEGTASWRGEIKQKEMQGALNLLDNDGNAQAFTFLSVNYNSDKK